MGILEVYKLILIVYYYKMCIDLLKKYIFLMEVFIMIKDFFDVVNECILIWEYDFLVKLIKEELMEFLEVIVKLLLVWNL